MAISLAIAFVAILHLLFMVLEMFFWTRPLGRRSFETSRELTEATAALADNTGRQPGSLSQFSRGWSDKGVAVSTINLRKQNFFPVLCHRGRDIWSYHGETLRPVYTDLA